VVVDGVEDEDEDEVVEGKEVWSGLVKVARKKEKEYDGSCWSYI
jgi:hypothetical protein